MVAGWKRAHRGAPRTVLRTGKVRKFVVFVDDLPRNAVGKVRRPVLRETYNALAASVASG
jgi:acyl-CoA synthetase (AMP-forming)/AMP-acid ligase II